MKLFEFEAKQILGRYGIRVPRGDVAASPQEAESLAREIARPVVLKSQVLVSGRGKAGGIVFARDAGEAGAAAARLLGSSVKGCLVERLLVEERLEAESQFYASLAVDRRARTYVLLASMSGGVDIEDVARVAPEKIVRQPVDFSLGFTREDGARMLSRFPLSASDAGGFARVLATLYEVALAYDAELVEINPLMKTRSGEIVAADARIIVDDNALFRHEEMAALALCRGEYTPRESEAKEHGLSYIDLDGDIGVIGNGAGLVMATIDLVRLFGGRPGNFLDLGGGGNVEKSERGIRLVMDKPEIRAILVNILGGITRCDVVALAVVQALGSGSANGKPFVVRMSGTNEDEAARILRAAGITSYRGMEEAVREVVRVGAQ